MSSQLTNNGGKVGLMMNGGTTNISGDVVVCDSSQDQLQLEEFEIPRPISTFKGREKQMDILDNLFFEKKKNKIVICGLPGYGKTELSKQYASKCVKNNKIDRAFWVEAEHQDNLHKSSTKLTKIYKKFEGKEKILFVFDNATSRQAIFNYEPPDADNFFLLITSIVMEWDNDVEPFKLDPLDTKYVVDVYQSILRNDYYQEEDRKLYVQLADLVGNIPLGLQITGAFVKQQKKRLGRGFNLESYIQTLKQSQTKIITSTLPPGTANPYRKSIHGAIKVSVDKISEEEDTELSELALNILYVCCYLNPRYWNTMLILNMFYCYHILLRSNTNSKDEFMSAIGLLENFCFIKYNPNSNLCNMHRFTQDVLRIHGSKYNQEMQSKIYRMCLQYYALTDDYNIEQIYVLSHADDNVTTVYKYFEEEKTKMFESKNENNLIKTLIKFGCIKCLRKILEESGELAKKYIDDNYLLHEPMLNNYIEIVELLLKHDADIENKNCVGNTPLHVAANLVSIETIKILTSYKADVNARNDRGDIPLFSLFSFIYSMTRETQPYYINCTFDLLKLLEDTRYSINMIMPYPKKINLKAIIDILDLLKYKENKDTINNIGQTLLHIVVMSCSKNIVKSLISKYKLDINKPNFEGRSPLYFLISQSNYLDKPGIVATARQLIMLGAKWDIKDAKGTTLIEFSENNDNDILMKSLCDNRCIDELKKIFEYLGDRTKDYIINKGYIQHAASFSQLDILNMLLQYDVDINQINPLPLHVAALAWRTDSMRILLEHNADVNALNAEGNTVLLSFFKNAYRRNNIKIETAADILDLLKFEDEKDITDDLGRTLLHIAADRCQEVLVTLLVKKYKFKTNVKDNFGYTPLQVLIANLDKRVKKKKSVINIVRLLGEYDDHLDDHAVFTILQNLIVDSGRDIETILPFLK